MEVKLRRDCEQPADELLTTLERQQATRKNTGVSAMAAGLLQLTTTVVACGARHRLRNQKCTGTFWSTEVTST